MRIDHRAHKRVKCTPRVTARTAREDNAQWTLDVPRSFVPRLTASPQTTRALQLQILPAPRIDTPLRASTITHSTLKALLTRSTRPSRVASTLRADASQTHFLPASPPPPAYASCPSFPPYPPDHAVRAVTHRLVHRTSHPSSCIRRPTCPLGPYYSASIPAKKTERPWDKLLGYERERLAF